METGILWVKPELVTKGWDDCLCHHGDPGASIPTPQPVEGRPMFGAFGKAVSSCCFTFVSQAACEKGIKENLRT